MAGGRTFTKQDLLELGATLAERHRAHLRPEEHLVVAHTRDATLETLTVDVVEGADHFRFEACVHLEDVDGEAATDILMGFLHAVLKEWLEGGREAYPTLDYSPYPFHEVTVGLRGGPHRPDLEAMAEALLAQAGGGPEEV